MSGKGFYNRRRVDANHKEVVDALRKAGYSVQSLAAIGHGCPDLLVARGGATFLVEVKDWGKSPSQRKLTTVEAAWHQEFRGSVIVVDSLDVLDQLCHPPVL